MKKYWLSATLTLSVVVLTIFAGISLVSWEVNASVDPEQQPIMGKAEFDQTMKSLSNWGRWGKEDQLGALNLITARKRIQAAKLVKTGISISLAHNLFTEKVGKTPAFELHMVNTGTPGSGGALDVLSIDYHGRTQTHFDALCHQFWDGEMYNGYAQGEVTDKGCAKDSVIQVKNGVFTRGVLIDFPWLYGTKYLTGSRAILPADLDAWEKKTGVKIQSGDAVFIRVGRWARWDDAKGGWDPYKEGAGLHVTSMAWFKKRDIALLASDMVSDVVPSGVEGVTGGGPVHKAAIVELGVPLIDNCDLEAVGEYAAANKRWDFLLTMAPLAIGGGTGSPINPIATF